MRFGQVGHHKDCFHTVDQAAIPAEAEAEVEAEKESLQWHLEVLNPESLAAWKIEQREWNERLSKEKE